MPIVLAFQSSIYSLIQKLQNSERLKLKHNLEKNNLNLSYVNFSQITVSISQTKLKIVEILRKYEKKKFESYQIFHHDSQKSFDQLCLDILVLNKDIQFLLEKGILNLFLNLSQFREKFIQKYQNSVLQTFAKQIIQVISNILKFFFAFQEYQNKLKINENQNIIKSLKSNRDVEKQEEAYSTLTNEKLFNSIKQQINNKPLQTLLDNYLHNQIDEIKQKKQKCKICSKILKLEILQKHVRLCQKKSSLKQQMIDLKLRAKDLKENAYCKLEQLKQSHEKNLQNESLKKIITAFLRQKISQKQNVNTIRKRTDSADYSKSSIGQKTRWENMIYEHEVQYKENKLLTQLILFQNQKQNLTKQMECINSLIQNTQYKKKPISNNKLNNFGNASIASSKSMKIADLSGSSKKSISLNLCFNEMLQCEDCINETLSITGDKSIDNILPNQLQIMTSFTDKMRSFKTKQSLIKKNQFQNEQQTPKNFVSLQHISFEEDSANVSMKDFQILKVLGKGAFGKVYMVRRKQTSDLYALKIIRLPENCSDKDFHNISTQNNIFKKIAGDHLVTAPFSFSQKGCHIFVMELMPGGDLRKLLQQQVYFEEDAAKFYLAEIVLAIEHLHNYQIIHRDLKPQNLVLDHQGHLKLTDYGLSAMKIEKKLERQRQFCINIIQEQSQKKKSKLNSKLLDLHSKSYNKANLIGTPDYIAPQIINRVSTQNKSIDWWSLGVMAYELLIGTRPFCSDTIEGILQNIEKFNIDWPQVDQQDGISSTAKDFIEKLLNKEFMKRLGAKGVQEIKDHPFFEGIDWSNIKNSEPPFPPDMEKINQQANAPEKQSLRKEIQDRLKQNLHCKAKVNKLKLQKFVRFDLLGTQTMETVQKIYTETSDRLRKLRSCQTFDIEEQVVIQCSKVPLMSWGESI